MHCESDDLSLSSLIVGLTRQFSQSSEDVERYDFRFES